MTMPFGPMRQAVIVGGSQRLYDAPGGAPIVPVDPPDPDPDIVASVSVSPPSFSVIATLDVQALTATPRNDTGGVVAGKTATWASSDNGVATVASTDNLAATVTAVAGGTATITATVDGINGTSVATVQPAVATVTVSPSTVDITVGNTQAVVATVLDSGGSPLTGRNINWSTTDGGIAGVSPTGGYTANVIGFGVGSATISATVESITATVPTTINAAAVFFTETFEDSALGSRGWYDITGMPITTSEAFTGSSSLQLAFAQGATATGGGRHLFPDSDSVYLSYRVKYSANWVGSGGSNVGPHEFYFVTNEDSAFVGPAFTNLTTYIEHNYQSGGIPRMEQQDANNIDTSNIGVDLTGITEARAAHGCNGFVETSHTGTPDCFQSGAYFNGRRWDASAPSFTEAPGSPGYKNDWHHVEAFVQLNTINGSGIAQPDGKLQYWFDGTLVLDHQNVLMRTGAHPTMKFNQLLIGPFIGVGSPVAQTMWVDDLTVAATRPGAFAIPDLLNNASFETGWDGFQNNNGGPPSSTGGETIARSTTRSSSGLWSVETTIPTGQTAVQFNRTYGNRTHVFVRWYYYATNWPTDHHKFMRFQIAGFGNLPYHLQTASPGSPFYWGFTNDSVGGGNNWFDNLGASSLQLNAWHYWEVELETSPVARARFWHDGIATVPTPNVSTSNQIVNGWIESDGGSGPAVGMIVFHGTINGGNSNPCTFYEDRVAISTQRIGP